jgi:hypothetical protein
MEIRYYMMCYRCESLVASHLDPEAFGRYMAVGTNKLTKGNVMFFEVTPPKEGPYFRLHDIAARCVPHPDGAPKRSKYISIYRVLEHLDFGCFGKLHLVTPDGRDLVLDAAPYDGAREDPGPNLYQELCPVTPMVASQLAPHAFAKFMTDPANPMHLPRLFFADQLVDMEDGRLAGYLPYADPLHVVDCVRSLGTPGKPTKTVSRTPDIVAFYRTIRRGFFLGDPSGVKFYPFPSRAVLEGAQSRWWRSAQNS